MATRWVVLKFGGTSVSTPERWRIIADLASRRIAEGLRPLVVCSALSGVSNQLEALLALAVEGRHEAAFAALRQRHLELGAALGIDADERLADDFEELSRLALAASLLREAGPALKARVMAFGELMSTRLGAAFLETQGIATSWLDARTALEAREDPASFGPRAYLSATCDFERDEALAARLASLPGVAILSQGFIARNREGQTVLLGRGGSDTSASYLAARLGAERCEIWTDVPGLFTANPSLLPSARLLRALNYEEAQEIATTGAKVLHPRCIPPLRQHRIPLHVLSTARPDIPGTVISASGPVTGPQVKAISSRSGITLIAMETVGMWQEVGFLAKAFEIFAEHGVSIDSVSTSETNVTVSLDPGANALEPGVLRALLADLSAFCEPQVIAPTASLSLVGRGIRAILHELGPVLEAFEELKIHLVTQAASDLNLTFIVDEDQSERLVRQLHGLLFGHQAEGPVFGPTWSELFGREGETPEGSAAEWWRGRRHELIDLAAVKGPLYVYDAETLRSAASSLRSLTAVDRLFYSLKANANPEVLRVFHAAGLSFECVSAAELDHVRSLFPDLDRSRLLFTPNFAPREEYVRGFAAGARVTLDNVHPLREWPEVFAEREVFLRLDPGRGRGHHAHVRTAGAQSKFGIAPEQLDDLQLLLAANETRVVGLHAHMGSGIRTPEAWQEVALFLAAEAGRFPDVRVLDLG
ncbi:MAG TPA: bifunctional aspartate kinase/diaminopimelate decarboxylase, partial [Thermoanaerobaculia bacterium]|nr:bifunctional aspartate kinase/diaminopimelate decarboxylase [Thermoanaerobaculia bacterium]